MPKTEILNAKQAAFIDNYLSGMTQTEAYAAAYDVNSETARRNASRLMLTNADVAEAVEKGLDRIVSRAGRTLRRGADDAAERMLVLGQLATKDFAPQVSANKDILDRVGLKAKDKVEHSGEVGISLIDILKASRKKHDDDDA